jgi:hypothetical protein
MASELKNGSMASKSSKVDLMSLPTEVHLEMLAIVDSRSLLSLTSINRHFHDLKTIELLKIVRNSQQSR